jgi:hypothetical protein
MSMRVKAFSLVVAALLLSVPASVLAIPSANFYGEESEVFDDWDICRTNAAGSNGFFALSVESGFQPIIAEESLGDNADVAYRMGLQFASEYPDVNQRAEQIFIFVRDSVRYASDKSQFGFPEFAQNADELGSTIREEGVAYGDCEDYAVLLAVIYKGAGLRSAIALTSDHAAALVYVPEYKKASRILSVNGESGWIWSEATGGNNPLGWMPEGYGGKVIEVREVENKALIAGDPPDKEPVTVTSKGGGGGGIPVPSFVTVIFIMWFLSLFRRRRRG